MSAASEITRRAKSNLAFALNILPREQREEMSIFYAYCRTIDDLADDSAIPVEERRMRLGEWRRGIIDGFGDGGGLEADLVALRDRWAIPNELLVAIIEGCEMDLEGKRFESWESLSEYIWKVSCAVGLVSIRLFGCQDPAAARYAVALGHALQLTNILRDVREDLENGGRIYLPVDEMARFGVSEADLWAGKVDSRFTKLMEFQAARAEGYFAEAEKWLPTKDRRALRPARMMGEIYQLLLAKMREDGYQVFTTRYKISPLHKLMIFSKHQFARNANCE